MEKQYAIKQVLFVVSHEKHQIIPIQVVEKTTRQTFDGNEILYKVRDPKGEKDYDLRTIKGDVFVDPYIVKDILKKKIIESIDQMVETSIKVAKSKFGYTDGGMKFQQSAQSNSLTKEEYSLDIEDIDENSQNIVSIQPQESLEIVDPNTGTVKKAKIGKVTLGEQKHS